MVAKVRINVPYTYEVAGRDAMRFMESTMQEIRALAVGILSQGEYTTGRLASTLELQGPKLYGTEVRGAVGSRADNALVVHDGAKIHEIFPKADAGHVYRFGSVKKPQLKFFWRKAGRVAYFPHIPGSPHTVGHSHPGMKGKKYLEIPLQIVGRRHGYKVTTRGL